MTFTGSSVKEAMDQVYRKAIEMDILDQIQIIRKTPVEKRGFLGLGKRTEWHVVVGVMEDSVVMKRQRKNTLANVPELFPSEKTDDAVTRPQPSIRQSTINVPNKAGNIPIRDVNYDKIVRENEDLKQEVNDIKETVSKLETILTEQFSEMKRNIMRTQLSQEVEKEKNVIEDVEISQENIKWAVKYLREREFAEFFIEDTMDYLKELKREVLIDKPRILNSIREFLRREIATEEISLENYNYGDTVLLAGPTGVGKTITIVKMAAHMAATRHKRMRFISIDKYKVGAESQLKEYAKIIKCPFQSIFKPEDFLELLEDDSFDYTFIDTAGKSPRETIRIKELSEWIQKTKRPIDVHLVVSASTKPGDLDFYIDAYSDLNFQHILATKLDETKSLGSVLSILYKTKRPVSFITNGQEVPADFEIANIEKMITETIK